MTSVKSAATWTHSVVKLKSIALSALMFAAGFVVSARLQIALKASANGPRECGSKPSKPGTPDACAWCKVHHPTRLRYCEENESFEAFCDGRRKAFQRAE